MANEREQYTMEVAGVPLLVVSRGPPVTAAESGTVLFVHGLGAAKELNRPELERFADAGFLAVGLDAVGHGQRRYPDFEARFGARGEALDRQLIETVVETAREVPRLIEALRGAGLAREGRVGLCGVSMGAFVGYAVAAKRGVDAVVALLGSPMWRVEVAERPTAHVESFYPCALLSQVAGRDEQVNPAEAREFHKLLEPRYAARPERLAFVEFEQSGHFMRAEDWAVAMGNSVEWFRRFLRR